MANRRRDKPLRTYGRQPSTTPEAQSSKKRKTTHEPSPLATSDEILHERNSRSPEPERNESRDDDVGRRSQTEEPKQEGDAPKAKKGTIMSFFKPIPPKPKQVEAQPEIEEEDESSRSPVSQPSAKRQRRAPRLLRIRPSLPADKSTEEDKENRIPTSTGEDQRSRVGTSPSSGAKAASSHKPKGAPSVQTTLNISSRAAFSECRLCDMVWNPSHADDVKYHKRRHAAVLRRRQVDVSVDS